jgi:hypothetical protein
VGYETEAAYRTYHSIGFERMGEDQVFRKELGRS